jgi:hypothetical protein
MGDNGCICEGNWRSIIDEYSGAIGKRFTDINGKGEEYRFFGIVYGDDDYYYGMSDGDCRVLLVSCAGSLEMMGFEEI